MSINGTTAQQNLLKRLVWHYSNLKYRFRIMFRYRPWVVFIDKPNSKWLDCDELMFHACFKVLGKFVNFELGKPNPEWGLDSQYKGYRLHSVGDEQAIDLWIWYRDELPALVYQAKTAFTTKVPLTVFQLEFIKDIYHLDHIKDRKLEELMKIRRTLWT